MSGKYIPLEHYLRNENWVKQGLVWLAEKGYKSDVAIQVAK